MHFCHILPAERFPHNALLGCIAGLQTRGGRLRKKLVDNVKEDYVNLTQVEATQLVEDRHYSVRSGLPVCEDNITVTIPNDNTSLDK